MIAGIGTDVGKTVVAAILTQALDGEYWKPIQCGENEHSDPVTMKKWIDPNRIHPPAYSFKACLSPHHAAALENRSVHLPLITPPQTSRPLIIESVGGVFVPLTSKVLSIDLFQAWQCTWIIVSKHYLGSINHTLLTIEALKQRQIPILGLIFNGEENSHSETAILEMTQIPFLARLAPEKQLNFQTIQKYAKQWQPLIPKLIR